MNKKTLGVGLGISMLMAVALNFVFSDASAYQLPMPCHNTVTSNPGSAYSYRRCGDCKTYVGQGANPGTCVYIQE